MTNAFTVRPCASFPKVWVDTFGHTIPLGSVRRRLSYQPFE